MLEFLEKYVKIGCFQVLTVYKSDQEDVFYLLKILNHKDKLEIASTSKYKNSDELICFLDVNKPLIIMIDGKGVLNKQLNISDTTDVQWEKNLDLNTFYFTKFITTDNVFASYIKKETVDGIVLRFKKLKFDVLDFYIGPFTSALLQQQVKTEKIYSNGLILNFNNNALENYKKNNEFANKKYSLGNQEIENWYLPQYGAIIDYKVKSNQIIKSKIETIEAEEYYYKRFFNFFGLFVLIFIFFSLIISYFTTGFYIKNNSDLKAEQVYLSQTLTTIKKLEADKIQKKILLTESGFLHSEYHHFYAYQILKTVPNGILFDSIEIKPTDAFKEGKKVLINTDIISLSGNFKENIIFNNWYGELKSLKWIKKITLLKFSKDKNQITQFTIQINI